MFLDPCATVTCTSPPDDCKETAGTCSLGNCAYPNKVDGVACTTVTNGICKSGTCTGNSHYNLLMRFDIILTTGVGREVGPSPKILDHFGLQ